MYQVITVWENSHEDVCIEFSNYIKAHQFVHRNKKANFSDDELSYDFKIIESK